MPEAKATSSGSPSFTTPQEEFWAGSFGGAYISRNNSEQLLASNFEFFSKILRRTGEVGSFIELGANVGMNLRALRTLLPKADLAAVEINAEAAGHLKEIPKLEVFNESLLGFKPPRQYEISLTKGVLIHINPESLPSAYQALYESSSRFICVAEYYNPSPVNIPYRGHNDRLFKRDFAGELLDTYPDLKIIDYGFAYHRGPFPQDDITWFLLEKQT